MENSETPTIGDKLKNVTTPVKTNPCETSSTIDNRVMRERLQRFAESGIDIRHADVNFDEIRGHEKFFKAFAAANSIMWAGGMSVLIGDRGNGKTQCGAELIRDACMKDKYGRYVRCREIGMKLREAYGKAGVITELGAVEHFCRPWLLVIDECQERMDSDFERRSLTLIIDKRYGAMKPTVLIANCDEPEFCKLLGNSIIDRVKESGGVIKFDWPSFRGRQ